MSTLGQTPKLGWAEKELLLQERRVLRPPAETSGSKVVKNFLDDGRFFLLLLDKFTSTLPSKPGVGGREKKKGSEVRWEKCRGREKKPKEPKAARRLSAVSLRFHFLPPQHGAP